MCKVRLEERVIEAIHNKLMQAWKTDLKPNMMMIMIQNEETVDGCYLREDMLPWGTIKTIGIKQQYLKVYKDLKKWKLCLE